MLLELPSCKIVGELCMGMGYLDFPIYITLDTYKHVRLAVYICICIIMWVWTSFLIFSFRSGLRSLLDRILLSPSFSYLHSFLKIHKVWRYTYKVYILYIYIYVYILWIGGTVHKKEMTSSSGYIYSSLSKDTRVLPKNKKRELYFLELKTERESRRGNRLKRSRKIDLESLSLELVKILISIFFTFQLKTQTSCNFVLVLKSFIREYKKKYMYLYLIILILNVCSHFDFFIFIIVR